MRADKKTTVSIVVDENFIAMIDAIKNKMSFESRASVVKQATRELYKKTFPSYEGKPTPMGGTLQQAKVIAKQRIVHAQAKSQAEKEIENEKLMSGKQMCEVFFKGSVNGLGGPSDQVTCRYSQVKGLVPYEPIGKMRLVDMPVLGEWENDLSAQEYVLANVFPNFSWDTKEKHFINSLKSNTESLRLGIERHQIGVGDVSIEALDLLMNRLGQHSINVEPLEEAIQTAGFRA